MVENYKTKSYEETITNYCANDGRWDAIGAATR